MDGRKKLNKTLIALLVFVFMVSSVKALSCESSEVGEIQILDDIEFLCETDNLGDRCISYIVDNESNLISSWPKDVIGHNRFFESDNGLVKISLDLSPLNAKIMSGNNYTYHVLCGDNEWNRSVMMINKDYSSQGLSLIVFVKQNIVFFMGFIVFLGIILVTILYFIKIYD